MKPHVVSLVYTKDNHNGAVDIQNVVIGVNAVSEAEAKGIAMDESAKLGHGKGMNLLIIHAAEFNDAFLPPSPPPDRKP